MAKDKDTNQYPRERIVELHTEEMAYRKISDQLLLPLASVGIIIQK